jgi:hypothetical protein
VGYQPGSIHAVDVIAAYTVTFKMWLQHQKHFAHQGNWQLAEKMNKN